MIVSLAEVKAALEIPEDDTSADVQLTRLILGASAWVQNTTHRYFDTPILRTEVHVGMGTSELFIYGHIDGPEVNDPSDTGELGDVTRIWSRLPADEWTELLEGVDWERLKDRFYRLPYPFAWLRWEQYKIQYMDGWVSAPDDIKALIMDMVTGQSLSESSAVSGLVGITSEKIGDYSYTLNPALVAASASSGFPITTAGWQTINNWKRNFA